MADNGGPELGNPESLLSGPIMAEDGQTATDSSKVAEDVKIKAEAVEETPRRGRRRKADTPSLALEDLPDDLAELPAVPSIADKVKKGRRASAAACDAIKKQTNPRQKRESTDQDEKPLVKDEEADDEEEATPARARGRRATVKKEEPTPRPTRGRIKAEEEQKKVEDTKKTPRKRGRAAAATPKVEPKVEDNSGDEDVAKKARKPPVRKSRRAKPQVEEEAEDEAEEEHVDEEREIEDDEQRILARRRKTDDEETDEAEELDDDDGEGNEENMPPAPAAETEAVVTSRAGRARKPIQKYEPDPEPVAREKSKKNLKKGEEPKRKMTKVSPNKRRKDAPSIDDELAAMQRGVSIEEQTEESQQILHAEDDFDTDSYVEDDEEPTTSDGRSARRGRGRPPVRFEDEPEEAASSRRGNRGRKKGMPQQPPPTKVYYDDVGGPPPLEGDPGVLDMGLDIGGAGFVTMAANKMAPVSRRVVRRKSSGQDDPMRLHSPLGNGAYSLENGLSYIECEDYLSGGEQLSPQQQHQPKKRGRKPKNKTTVEATAQAQQETGDDDEKDEPSVSMRGRARKPVKRNDMVYFGDKDRERKIQQEAAKMRDPVTPSRRGRKPRGGGAAGGRAGQAHPQFAVPTSNLDAQTLLGDDIALPFEEIQSILAREAQGPVMGGDSDRLGAKSRSSTEEEDVEIPTPRGRELATQQDTVFISTPRPPALDDHTYYIQQIPASLLDRGAAARGHTSPPVFATTTPGGRARAVAATTRSIGQIGALSPTNARKIGGLASHVLGGAGGPVKIMVRAPAATGGSELAAHLTGQVAATQSGNSGTDVHQSSRTALSQAELL